MSLTDADADDMCPNCVTPWKCNGPHIDYDDESFLRNLMRHA